MLCEVSICSIRLVEWSSESTWTWYYRDQLSICPFPFLMHRSLSNCLSQCHLKVVVSNCSLPTWMYRPGGPQENQRLANHKLYDTVRKFLYSEMLTTPQGWHHIDRFLGWTTVQTFYRKWGLHVRKPATEVLCGETNLWGSRLAQWPLPLAFMALVLHSSCPSLLVSLVLPLLSHTFHTSLIIITLIRLTCTLSRWGGGRRDVRGGQGWTGTWSLYLYKAGVCILLPPLALQEAGCSQMTTHW